MLYSDEVWTGTEYQVAGHMIYEGMIEEAYAIIKGARDRYDGIPEPPIGRNPWNEIECGGHYARAMSSWSILTGTVGLRIRRPDQVAAIHAAGHARSTSSRSSPGRKAGARCCRPAASGKQGNEIHVVEGQLVVSEIRLAPAGRREAGRPRRRRGRANHRHRDRRRPTACWSSSTKPIVDQSRPDADDRPLLTLALHIGVGAPASRQKDESNSRESTTPGGVTHCDTRRSSTASRRPATLPPIAIGGALSDRADRFAPCVNVAQRLAFLPLLAGSSPAPRTPRSMFLTGRGRQNDVLLLRQDDRRRDFGEDSAAAAPTRWP